MELNAYFKSVLEQDTAAIVICDLNHTIIYMNPAAAKSQAKHGGAALVGQNLMKCHSPHAEEMIRRVVAWFAESEDHNIVFTYHNQKHNRDVYMVALRDDDRRLIGYYEKHAYRTPEAAEPYHFEADAKYL